MALRWDKKWLAVPAALETVGALLPGGWPALRARNRELALAARRVLCGALGIPPPSPDDMIGSLATLPLPDSAPDAVCGSFGLDALGERLLTHHRVEVPVFAWPAPPRRCVRISAQLYNTATDYERLAEGLRAELPRS